jgi:hypothetical protein
MDSDGVRNQDQVLDDGVWSRKVKFLIQCIQSSSTDLLPDCRLDRWGGEWLFWQSSPKLLPVLVEAGLDLAVGLSRVQEAR